MWGQLFGNLAFVTLSVAMWAHFATWYRMRLKEHFSVVWGVYSGLSAIGSIILAVPYQSGVFVDLRYALVVLSGAIGGPISAVIAVVLSISFRAYLGGIGAADGIVTIAVAAITGSIFYLISRGKRRNIAGIIGLTVCLSALLVMLLATLPVVRQLGVLYHAGAPLIMMNALAVLLSGLILLKASRAQLERRVLEFAYAQSPDYVFVKGLDGRYISGNTNIASLYKLDSADALIGASELSLSQCPGTHARHDVEQTVMNTGIPLLNELEDFGDRKFRTSRVPIRSETGEVLGLAGISRDITDRIRLEEELRQSRNLLAMAMNGMSEGFAMFDRHGILVFCNENYRSAFPLSRHARVEGAHITDILRASVALKERVDHPAEATEAWINSAAATLHHDKDEVIELSNGDWRLLKTRLSEDGSAMVIVSDITQMKTAEIELERQAEQLRSLADRDGLTGLANRRHFDMTLKQALNDRKDARTPLSLLMIDVDRFKSYNDAYGHIVGDTCLREVAACLKAAAPPGSEVARYGGEEFSVLLPGADGRQALHLAETFLQIIIDKAMPHIGSEFQVVTASIGVASFPNKAIDCELDLLQAADTALYQAKHRGRSRVIQWHPAIRSTDPLQRQAGE